MDMEWIQVLAIASSTIGACWFMHRESVSMHRENISMHKETAKEMKDFHGRLCTLEERHLQLLQRFLEKK